MGGCIRAIGEWSAASRAIGRLDLGDIEFFSDVLSGDHAHVDPAGVEAAFITASCVDYSSAGAQAGRIEQIRERGVLRVGVSDLDVDRLPVMSADRTSGIAIDVASALAVALFGPRPASNLAGENRIDVVTIANYGLPWSRNESESWLNVVDVYLDYDGYIPSATKAFQHNVVFPANFAYT